MKVNKTQAILLMLMTLFNKGKLSRIEILQEIDISEQTFRRYIQELRAFLFNFNVEENLVYVRTEDRYYLKKQLCIKIKHN